MLPGTKTILLRRKTSPGRHLRLVRHLELLALLLLLLHDEQLRLDHPRLCRGARARVTLGRAWRAPRSSISHLLLVLGQPEDLRLLLLALALGLQERALLDRVRDAALRRERVLGWPKRCKLARACLWEY